MSEMLSIEEALKVAISAEIRASTLYTNTSRLVKNPGSKKMLLELAEQEKGHRKILEQVVQQQSFEMLGKTVPKKTRGIAEFLTPAELDAQASIQEVIIFAMNEETKAYNFYQNLKNEFIGSELEKLFDGLAAEERGHKIKLEDEYEAHFLTEN